MVKKSIDLITEKAQIKEDIAYFELNIPFTKLESEDEVSSHLTHEMLGLIDEESRVNIGYFESKKKGLLPPSFLLAFQRFCLKEDFKNYLSDTTDKDRFEWAIMSLLSLTNIPTIWLPSKWFKEVRDSLVTKEGKSVGGIDGLGYSKKDQRSTLLLIGCTLGDIKDDIEKMINVKRELEKEVGPDVTILQAIFAQRKVSAGLDEQAGKSHIAIFDIDRIKNLYESIEKGATTESVISMIRYYATPHDLGAW